MTKKGVTLLSQKIKKHDIIVLIGLMVPPARIELATGPYHGSVMPLN